MAENRNENAARTMKFRHRGRGAQVWIYLGKMLRMFVYQSDWKVLPMAALVAGLVGIVINKRFFITMEGTTIGSFAMVCVCIWNGAFNSIQVICRERDVIKREHRSGMHISSYIFSHMLYQALLCLAQTIVTLYVTRMVGVQYPSEGLFTPWFMVDFAITLFLITYASDMLSLFVSALAKNTTTAMTIMPFILIFQLVFSGGMFQLPAWTQPISRFTVSGPGVKAVAAQADVNSLPFVTMSDMLTKMRDNEVTVTVTVGQLMDLSAREDIDALGEIREIPVNAALGIPDIIPVTLGDVLDQLSSDEAVQAHREDPVTIHSTIGEMLDLVGEDTVKSYMEESAASTRYNPAYDRTKENIRTYWLHLIGFVFLFALLATVLLEFIDKDRR